MYAIVEIQGKQYRVKENDKIEVDSLKKDSGKVTFDKVMLYAKDDKNVDIGHPYIDGAYIEAEILNPVKGEKIRVFKKKSKKRYERTIGFRKSLSLIQIKGIAFGAKKAEAKKEVKVDKKEVPAEQPKVQVQPKAPVKTAAKKTTTRTKKASSKDQQTLDI